MNRNYNDRVFFPAAPFILGALTGGAAVSFFNPYRPRPYYPVNNYPPYYGVPYGYY